MAQRSVLSFLFGARILELGLTEGNRKLNRKKGRSMKHGAKKSLAIKSRRSSRRPKGRSWETSPVT